HVVPEKERARRESTLRARLENAADTRLADTNATEALRVLEDAAARYSCPELEATIKVETAIQRLELKRQTLESDIQATENDLAMLSGPLEELAGIVAEEKRLRDWVARLEDERRRARAAEIADRLRRDG